MKRKDGLKTGALIADAEKSPFFHIAIVALLAIGLSSLPIDKLFTRSLGEGNAYLLGGALNRLLLFAAAVVLSIKYGFDKPYKTSGSFARYALILPLLLVVVNNFPLLPIFSGNAGLTADGTRAALYILYCFSVAAFEETVFRGIIFPLSYVALKNKPKRLFWSAVLSSAVFALAHIFNLFAGAGFGATILQIGYSFLIGGLCAVSLIAVKNIYVPVIFHFIYDLGGFFCDEKIGVAGCARWDTVTVVLTAVLGVIVCAYTVILAIKLEKSQIENPFSDERSAETEQTERTSAGEKTDEERKKTEKTGESPNDDRSGTV